MAKLSYEEQANNLSKAIDIAINAFQEHPPKGFDKSHIDHITNTYLDARNRALNPEPQFKKVSSLKYIVEEVFTYFQEATGDTVNLFWKEINTSNLPYKRQNKLTKILKRNKIKNKVEYDFITDVIVPYEQEGLLNDDDINTLNHLLKEFENKK
ncbi:MAG: hypothetical protein ACK5L5_08800 [Bacteroidales bacterium]